MDHNYMHMYNLNVSHSGDYQCVVLYSDGNNSIDETDIHLSVTGMSVLNLTFKNVFDCLSFQLFDVVASYTLQYSELGTCHF